MRRMTGLGVGIGWRPTIDLTVERLPGVQFVEVVAENVPADQMPDSLRELRARGVPVVPHGVSLSLGGAQPPDPRKLAHLAALAELYDAPVVSEHVAFCRAGGVEAGHLLPVSRTRDALDVTAANIAAAQAALPVPLAVENIAALVAWPEDEMTEAEFLCELVDRTGVLLLVDVANLYTAHVNFGADPSAVLDALPLENLAYVHIAGGMLQDGLWHDTHGHAVTAPILDVLSALVARTQPPGVLLERDYNYPTDAELAAELAAIRAAAGTTAPPIPNPARRTPPDAKPQQRRALAQRQQLLVDSLAAGAEPPPDMDPHRISTQAAALRRKHARSAHHRARTKRRWPRRWV